MSAVIPSMDGNSQRVSFGEGSLLKEMKSNNQGPNLIKLETKEPTWSKEKEAYVMDFNGRVKKGSVKNFQLACPASPDEEVMQFGRVDEDRFVLDFKS
ncbi:protein king tubby 2-like [Colossoma macropomum]|uniref:protein king tubby 2-like n=1 Tax=Colossoma macropomum TaxID=42526 RepID=UPI001864EBCA|nr:protein king tubby 2-like [Colossoma macropomum]